MERDLAAPLPKIGVNARSSERRQSSVTRYHPPKRGRDEMYQAIGQKVATAATKHNKIAMFHLQVLMHANELATTDPVYFCHRVKVPESYATEFRKMISLARLMREEGLTLAGK